MYTKQGSEGRVRIRVEIGVHNYITTLTLTTRGTNTFLCFGEEDSLELDALETLFNSFSTRSTRFTTVFKIDVISLRADLTSGSVQLTSLSLMGCGLLAGQAVYPASKTSGSKSRLSGQAVYPAQKIRVWDIPHFILRTAVD